MPPRSPGPLLPTDPGTVRRSVPLVSWDIDPKAGLQAIQGPEANLERISHEINIPMNRGARVSREQCLWQSSVPRHQQAMRLAVPWCLGPLSSSVSMSRLPLGAWFLGWLDFEFVSRPCSLEPQQENGSSNPLVPRDLRHQLTNRSMDPRSTRDRRDQAPCVPSPHQRLDPLVTQHQAGDDAQVPRFLDPTFPREQGTVAAGRPRRPWKQGSKASRSQESRGPWQPVALADLGNKVPRFLGRRTTQVSSPTWSLDRFIETEA